MVEAKRLGAKILCGGCVVALAAAIALAGCGGKGGSTSTPLATGTTSSQATLSAADAKVLVYVNKLTKLIDDSAGVTKDFVASLKSGKWLRDPPGAQLATLTNMETFGQTLLKQVTDGFPPATAADLSLAEKGVLRKAAKASSNFISIATLAASDTIYMSAEFLKDARAKWEKRVLAKQPEFETARAALTPVLAALNAKYGYKP